MQYAYGMTDRGFAPNCQPTEDFVEVLEDISDSFYNILLYRRKLSEKELKEYNLCYLGKISE